MTLKELEKRLKKEPDNLGLRVQVAGLMRESGRSTEAVELYRSVALAYRDQGRTQQAIAVCKAILEIAPDDERCIALLSTLTGRSSSSIPSIAPPATGSARSKVASSQPPVVLSRPAAPTHPPPVASRPSTASQPPPVASRPAAPSQPPPVASRPAVPSQPPPVGSRPKVPTRPPSAAPQPTKTPSQPPRIGIQPPKTSSRPPVVVIPPKATIPPRVSTARPASEITGTPAPAPARPPTEPAPPSPVTSRLPLEPPARKTPSQPPSGEPRRRSSLEETPLPRAVPHHVHDPTGRNASIDPEDLDTNPNAEPSRTKSGTGLAEAARKISDKMKGIEKSDEDVSRPLDTRPVRRIKSDELEKIQQPPPTVENERVSEDSIATASGEDEELTTPQSRLDPDDV